MRKSRHAETDDEGLGKASSAPKYNYLRVAEIAAGIGDPQCYKGKAGRPPRFKIGDRLRVKDQPDLFYNQTPGYIRGAVGTVEDIAYESPAPEDEAWGHIDKVEWFYVVCFRHEDLWDDDSPDTNPDDTIRTEISERWLEPV
ncbi:nitrile hydratase subunit beta [Sulfurifustis variabilis]|uniref:Nitrile hydratase subunit beta n=1 Tax=Sulfurifustis variabilis TaxID=1675686 RepID=A0A1B4V6R5_9GAMM|nr:SH3-like domain-containing protein [Sulfurifustis variabilis]BAU49239.1 nitrile hydratase subunit beta [Sulfurifustis variabilis]